MGFVLDLERGYWEQANDAESDDPQDVMSKRTQRVIPYVEDTRNALLVSPAQKLDAATMASLESALKVAFQVAFQLEEAEMASEPLPSTDERNLLLFYESAEGGAGVLRRLVDEPDLWAEIAAEALQRCHIDPSTMEDVQNDQIEPCEAACYDCLLSYRNQPHHQLLDRRVTASRRFVGLGGDGTAERTGSNNARRRPSPRAARDGVHRVSALGRVRATRPTPRRVRGSERPARFRVRRCVRRHLYRHHEG